MVRPEEQAVVEKMLTNPFEISASDNTPSALHEPGPKHQAFVLRMQENPFEIQMNDVNGRGSLTDGVSTTSPIHGGNQHRSSCSTIDGQHEHTSYNSNQQQTIKCRMLLFVVSLTMLWATSLYAATRMVELVFRSPGTLELIQEWETAAHSIKQNRQQTLQCVQGELERCKTRLQTGFEVHMTEWSSSDRYNNITIQRAAEKRDQCRTALLAKVSLIQKWKALLEHNGKSLKYLRNNARCSVGELDELDNIFTDVKLISNQAVTEFTHYGHTNDKNFLSARESVERRYEYDQAFIKNMTKNLRDWFGTVSGRIPVPTASESLTGLNRKIDNFAKCISMESDCEGASEVAQKVSSN